MYKRQIENGHLVRGFKPVYWSVVGASALAEAEVEYQDKMSFSIDVAFPVVDTEAFLALVDDVTGEGPVAVAIWTTTPWTLPSNQAVSLNPELDYVLVQCDAGEGVGEGVGRFLLAEELVPAVMKRWGVEDYRIVGRVKGLRLENQLLQHPFYDRQVPVLLGDHVTTETGTGCVHTAPDHGMEDFVVANKYGIGTLNYIDDHGLFRDSVPLFAGEHVYKADEAVVALLKQRGVLLATHKITHSYAHCWRTKTPLIYRATPQWFIGMQQNGLLDNALKAVKDVTWYPSWGQARIEGMLENSPDWCISRQRTWGVPITLFLHRETGDWHPRTAELIEVVAQRVEQAGIDAWFDLDASELLGDEAADYTKVTDTLDVWFDSGVTHAAVLDARDQLAYPADLYLEGSDQHRGWFQSSLKTAIAIKGSAPYRAVLTHGFTVDADGRKMSKSLGNVMSPQQVVNDLGADVLRLWVAATDFSAEMSVSEEILKRTADSYRRIRNTARFLLSNLNGFDPARDLLPVEDMLELDRWAVGRAASAQRDILAAYDSYHFHPIYQKLHNFCSNDLGGFYLDVIKDRQYTTQADSRARRSVQTALYHIAEALVRWVAPILSFTAEEIWENLPGERAESVLLSEWYNGLEQLDDNEAMGAAYWQQVMAVRTAVNREIEVQRAAGLVRGSLDTEVTLYVAAPLRALLESLQDELRFVLITSGASLAALEDAPETAAETELSELRLQVDVSEAEKCERCWHRRDDVGQHSGHPTLCGRCVDNVDGSGEQRHFA